MVDLFCETALVADFQLQNSLDGQFLSRREESPLKKVWPVAHIAQELETLMAGVMLGIYGGPGRGVSLMRARC